MSSGHSSSTADSGDAGKKKDSTVAYDLTTYNGMVKAAMDYADQNPVKAAVLGGLVRPKPLAAAFLFAGKAAVDAVSKRYGRSEKALDTQRRAAIDIIKSGKENGVKKMKVTLDQNAGVDIGGELHGYAVKFALNSDRKMTIEVEY